MLSKTMKVVFLAGVNYEDGVYTKYVGEKYRQFREAYRSLFDILTHNSVEVYFTRVAELSHDGTFEAYYVVEQVTDEAIIFKKIIGHLKPDLIVNRVKDLLYKHPAGQSRPWKIYNEYEVARYGDKSISQQVLSDFMPDSLLVNAQNVDMEVVDDFFVRHEVAVIKPLRLNGGQGIELVRSAAALRAYCQQDSDVAVVLQEFIETSGGALGVSSGRHDVRLYVIDGEVQMLAVRQPREGGFLANTSAGGSIAFDGAEAVPPELRKLMQQLKDVLVFETNHYFISFDFFYGNNKWYLIEINDQPGIPAAYQSTEAHRLHDRLAASMIGCIS